MRKTDLAKQRGVGLMMMGLAWWFGACSALRAQQEDQAPQERELAEARQEIRELQAQLREASARTEKYRQIALKNREIALKVKAVAEQWQEKCAIAEAKAHEERLKYKQLNARMNRAAGETTAETATVEAALAQQRSSKSDARISARRANQKERMAQAGSPPNFRAVLEEHYPTRSEVGAFYSIRNVSPPELVWNTRRYTYCWLVTFEITQKRPKRRGNLVELIKKEGKGYAFFQGGRIIDTYWGSDLIVPTYYNSKQQVVSGRRL